MHKVTENDLYTITQPVEIFTQTNKIYPTELDHGGNNLSENHQNNGALPLHGT